MDYALPTPAEVSLHPAMCCAVPAVLCCRSTVVGKGGPDSTLRMLLHHHQRYQPGFKDHERHDSMWHGDHIERKDWQLFTVTSCCFNHP